MDSSQGIQVVYEIQNKLEDFPKFGVFDKM